MTGVVDGSAVFKWRRTMPTEAAAFVSWISKLVGVDANSIKASSLDGLELTVECYTMPKRLNAAKDAAETYVKVLQLDREPPVWPEDWMLS